MNTIENDVYTAVKAALLARFGDEGIFVTGEYTPTPPFFPCAYISEADNFNAGFDGSNNEVVTGVMYEAEVFTNKLNGKKTEAKAVMKLIDGIMTSFGFTRTFLQQLPNMNDATIFRLTARYTASVINNTIYRR